MNAEQLAQLRHNTYQFLSVILLDRVTTDIFESVRQFPNLPNTVPHSLDDWKAMHYALFGLNVYPYENEFLNEDGFLGGTVTQSLATLYDHADFQADETEPLDHIGNQLAYMASLSMMEAEAHHDEVIQAIHHAKNLQRQMLDDHLLRWTPAFVMAIVEQGDETFSYLAEILRQTVLEHRDRLDDNADYPNVRFTMPPIPDILNQSGTGFREIADYLLTPAYSGFYLSRDDIVRLSQAVELPHGHGKRHLMLTQLMNSAIEAGRFIDLLNALEEKVALWRNFYLNQVTIPPFADPWIDRLDTTNKFLKTIRSEL